MKLTDHNTVHLDPKQTWIPVTLTGAVLVACAGAAWSLAGWKISLDKNTIAIEKLELKMDSVLALNTGVRLWIAALAAKNPTLIVPELPR